MLTRQLLTFVPTATTSEIPREVGFIHGCDFCSRARDSNKQLIDPTTPRIDSHVVIPKYAILRAYMEAQRQPDPYGSNLKVLPKAPEGRQV